MPAAISPKPRHHGTTKPYVKLEPPSPSAPPAQLTSAGPPSRASTEDVKPDFTPKLAVSAKTGYSKPGRKPRVKSAESGRPWTGEEKIQLLHFALERNGRGFGEAVPGRTASQASQTWNALVIGENRSVNRAPHLTSSTAFELITRVTVLPFLERCLAGK